jgi:hypothetical protein
MPNPFDAQKPSGEDEQAQQHQPFKPKWLDVPVGVFIFETREKRLQVRPPKQINNFVTGLEPLGVGIGRASAANNN